MPIGIRPATRLVWLNNTKGWAEGLDDFGTAEYRFKVYAFK